MSTIFQAGLPLSKTIASKTKQSLKQIKTKQTPGSRCAPTGLRRASLEFIKGHQSSRCSVSKKYPCVLFQKTKQKQKQTKTPTSLPDQQGQMMQVCIFCRINPTFYILNILKVISGFSNVSLTFVSWLQYCISGNYY